MAKLPEQKRAPLPSDWPAIRVELCGRVNLVELMRANGHEVKSKKVGAHYLAKIRQEKTHSCHVYPPGVGRYGYKGWTFHDYGSDTSGDALSYLVDVLGWELYAGILEMCRLAHYDEAKIFDGTTRKRLDGQERPKPAPIDAAPGDGIKMEEEAQTYAARILLDGLQELEPDSESRGRAYLLERGLDIGNATGLAYYMSKDTGEKLAKLFTAEGVADFMTIAGLMKEPTKATNRPRLQWEAWAGDVVLIVHHTPSGLPFSFIARRATHKAGDVVGKYLQQTYGNGANRVPFGLPSLYSPKAWPLLPRKHNGGRLIIVEGPLDALGAHLLGWPALGMSMRPDAGDLASNDKTCPKMLAEHLPAMRELEAVLVMPDNDAEPEKRKTGLEMAARLVAWLRVGGCKARLATLEDVAAEGCQNCKDLADVAKAAKAERKGPTPTAEAKQQQAGYRQQPAGLFGG